MTGLEKMSTKKETWKEEFLDSVHPRKDIGAVVEPDEILAPFESKDAVMYAFCTGCSLLFELKPDGAAALFSLAEEPYRVEQGLYFELGSCGVCKGPDERIELRKVEQNKTRL